MSISSRARRARTAFDKMRWGVRVVGLGATVQGAARFAVLRIRRPRTTTVRLRQSGNRLTFAYPSQMVPTLVVFGDLIDPEYAFLQRALRPEWTVLDVGAAIGQFSVFVAGLGARTVHAFEPSRENVATLVDNVAANGLSSQVTVHQRALAGEAGSVVFSTAPNAYLSRIDRVSTSDGAGAEHYDVPVTTLDDVVGELHLDGVTLLKLNVSGFEPEVLDGGRALLRLGRVDVLVLLIGEQSYPWYRELSTYGYRFFFFHPKHNQLHEVREFDDEGLRAARPWPARHLIGISAPALDAGVLGRDITIMT